MVELGVKSDIKDTLKERVVNHREKFVSIFTNRYLELLPTLINVKNSEATSIDFLKVEVALRFNYDVVIGMTTKDNLQILGFVRSPLTSENPIDLFSTNTLTKEDITFTIPTHLIPKEMKEISHYDDCATGNFVVLRNKSINFQDDTLIIKHYVDELAEIVLSRFSISMQIKIMTFFRSEINDNTIDTIISDLFLGSPIVKTSNLFDVDEDMIKVDNSNASANMESLKKEYQNKISELNNMLGINSLAVEKNSGVSDSEAKSNRSFTTSNANIYLAGRNHGLEKLNKRYENLNLEALYNDEVASEFGKIAYSSDTTNEGE